MKVVCVIPALNEEKTVRKTVEKTMLHVDTVIVVDDGSADKTYEEAVKSGAIVLRNKKTCGLGGALRVGYRKALDIGATLIIKLDADGEHNPDDIPKLLQTMVANNKDIVVGSRFLNESSSRGMPLLKLFSNRVSTLLFDIVYKARMTDSQGGFRVYRRRVLETVHCKDDGMLVETEMLIRSVRSGLTIAETPIAYVSSGSKLGHHSLIEIFRYLFMLIRCFRCKQQDIKSMISDPVLERKS